MSIPTGTTPAVPTSDPRTCECGCGTAVRKRFVSGHNRRGATTSDEHRARIGASQREAWRTKRERMPLGSRRKDANGYWLVKVIEGGGRWDKEHVLVAEHTAGRRLAPDEHVHHINCIRDDNRAENLAILRNGDHARAHASLNKLVDGLIRDGHIAFDHGAAVYRRV